MKSEPTNPKTGQSMVQVVVVKTKKVNKKQPDQKEKCENRYILGRGSFINVDFSSKRQITKRR